MGEEQMSKIPNTHTHTFYTRVSPCLGVDRKAGVQFSQLWTYAEPYEGVCVESLGFLPPADSDKQEA